MSVQKQEENKSIMGILKILKKKYMLLSFVCIFIVGHPVLLADTAIPSITRAETMMRKGHYLIALNMFKEIARDTDNGNLKAQALFYSGKTNAIYLDRQGTALSQFNEIIDHHPQSRMAEPALINCGIIYLNQREYQNAYPLFAKYLAKYPNGKYADSAKKWAAVAKDRIHRPYNASFLGPSMKNPINENTEVRVLLQRYLKKIRFGSSQTIRVSDHKTGKMFYSGWGPVFIGRKGRNLFLNNHIQLPSSITISSSVDAMYLNSRAYRGFFRISMAPEGLLLVNHVPIESYLYSVVPKEMPDSWPMHALMAQAVAARTYALFMKEKNQFNPYDVEATTSSQVYGGYTAETIRARHAVNATAGQVMTYKGKLILAFFHSNSGGYTENPIHVWDTYFPYLRGRPDQYSENTPDSTWEYFLSYKEVIKKLNQSGLKIDTIRQLKAAGKSKSGRNIIIEVVSDSGIQHLKSNQFRESVGETHLKSTFFNMIHRPGGILFKGKGFGHGVGMSQWGANHMAVAGENYINILKYYYQGIDIVTPQS